MCGVIGVLAARPVETAALVRCRDRMAARGPDGAGLWTSSDGRVALGHRRLAVIDPVAASDQPLASSDGRFVCVLNGEIYNYRALRAELERGGARFRTRSDTEVLIELWRRDGPAALDRCAGMFAFALWDAVARRLHCARDRAGEKPFHYAVVDGAFVFASELGALAAWPGFPRRIDGTALVDFFAFGFVADPKTIWRDARKLPPGTRLEVALPLEGPPGVGEPIPYWDLTFAPDRATRDWGEEIRATLKAAVAETAVADVPCGAFLSGGVDSSAVVAAAASAGIPLKAFVAGFDAPSHDERRFARLAAERCGAPYAEVVVGPEDARAAYARGPRLFGEPFNDHSYAPTSVLCRFARREITVALSGDGSDELFAGYRRYQRVATQALWRRRAPAAARALVRAAAVAAPLKEGTRRTLAQYGAPADEMFADMLTVGVALATLRPYARGVLREALADYGPRDVVRAHLRAAPPEEVGLVDAMRYLDFKLTLGGGVLTKVDRASMASALETRSVFLHVALIDLARRLPAERLAERGVAKSALKAALRPWLPDEILYRRKSGFAAPLGTWLRADSGICGGDDDALAEVLDPAFVRRLAAEHAEGRVDRASALHACAFLGRWLAGDEGPRRGAPVGARP